MVSIMKLTLLAITLVFYTSCSKTHKDTCSNYETEEYKDYCNRECQKDYGTNVSWVGLYTGDCYCE